MISYNDIGPAGSEAIAKGLQASHADCTVFILFTGGWPIYSKSLIHSSMAGVVIFKLLPCLPLGLQHPRRPRGSQSGREKGCDESFQVRAKEPLGTNSHRAISKNSSWCRLLIGHKKCFVLLCPIGEQFLLSSFREFVHNGYCFDHGLSDFVPFTYRLPREWPFFSRTRENFARCSNPEGLLIV